MTRARRITQTDLEHRKLLIEIGKEQQHELDKALLTLSGGSLGVSLVFLKDVIGAGPVQAPAGLPAAWICFATSMVLVLLSGYCSNWAIQRGITQIDEGTARSERFGGWLSVLTACLNFAAPCLFIAGVALITHFACVNLANKEAFNGSKTTSNSSAASAAATPSAAGTSTASAPDTGHPRREQGVDAGRSAAASVSASSGVGR